jgi:hypothetical protein
MSDKKNQYTLLIQEREIKKEQNIYITKNITEKEDILQDILKKELYLEENK